MASTDNLIHCWKLNDPAGSTTSSDKFATSVWDMTEQGTSGDFVAGQIGNCWQSVSGHEGLQKTGLSVTNPDIFTVECRIYTGTSAANLGFYLFKDSNNYISVDVFTPAGTRWAHAIFKNGGSYAEIVGGTALSNNTEYHIAAVFDTTSNLLKLYVNGVSDASAVALTLAPISGLITAGIGNHATIYNSGNGRTDEVRMWDDERSDAEILAWKDKQFYTGKYLNIARTSCSAINGVLIDNVASAIGVTG